MKIFTNDDIKQCGLRILNAVHKFCEDHNLKYVLFYGTLLGAVRHKGYIPWDDDIDIAMPRDDYEFFIKNFDTEKNGVISCTTNKYYFLPWAKAFEKGTVKKECAKTSKRLEIGFNIDVFPVDFLSSPEAYWIIKKKEYGLIKKLVYGLIKVDKITKPKDFIKLLLQIFYHPNKNKISKKIEYFFINHDLISTNKTVLVTNSVFMGIKTRAYIFPIDLFKNRQLSKFENNEFFIPRCFDEVLKTCYGNYMQLPPIEEQKTHHSFVAYYK